MWSVPTACGRGSPVWSAPRSTSSARGAARPSTPTPAKEARQHDTTAADGNHTIRNGVDTATLFATLDAVKQTPQAASFQFRAHNQWHSGTHNRTRITDFFGVGEERTHTRSFVFDADHPAVLVGQDHGPTPVEFILHALAACLANIAAARKVKLTEVHSSVTGDIDLNGILGLDPTVRNGYQQITIHFTIKVTPQPRRCANSWTSHKPARRSTTSSPTRSPSPSKETPSDPTPPLDGPPKRPQPPHGPPNPIRTRPGRRFRWPAGEPRSRAASRQAVRGMT
jgi:uncharacterized OsmC-like protein